VLLTSRVGSGTVAVTIILVFLVAGVWFFGNRLASQLTNQRKRHA
jgi:hypothetical protein